MVRFLPNLITLLNLISGCFAIVAAIKGDVQLTIVFLAASLIFDFADGLVARLLNAYSDLGKELDSLADLVSFGVAPALLLRWLILDISQGVFVGFWSQFIVNFPFIMVASTAYRLARFNLDSSQSTVFKGLPAPANALLIISFIQLIIQMDWHQTMPSDAMLAILLGVVIFQSYILVSTVPMFALKFKNYSFRDNKIRYLFLGLSVIAFIVMGFSGFFPVILLYIAVSILHRRKNN